MGEEVQGRMEWGSRVEVVGVLDKVVCNDSDLKNHSEKEEEPSGLRNMQRFLLGFCMENLQLACRVNS